MASQIQMRGVGSTTVQVLATADTAEVSGDYNPEVVSISVALYDPVANSVVATAEGVPGPVTFTGLVPGRGYTVGAQALISATDADGSTFFVTGDASPDYALKTKPGANWVLKTAGPGSALASKLVAAWLITETTGTTITDLVSGISLNLAGGASVGPLGLSLKAAGARAVAAWPASLQAAVTQQMTLFVRVFVDPLSAPDGDMDHFGVTFNNVNVSPYSALTLGNGGGSRPIRTTAVSGTGPSVTQTFGSDNWAYHNAESLQLDFIASRGPNGVLTWRAPATADVGSSLGATQIASAAASASFGYGASPQVAIGDSLASGKNPREIVACAFIFGSQLSDDEVQAMTSDPYQMFEAPAPTLTGTPGSIRLGFGLTL